MSQGPLQQKAAPRRSGEHRVRVGARLVGHSSWGADRGRQGGTEKKSLHVTCTPEASSLTLPSCGGIKKVTCVFTKVSTGVRRGVAARDAPERPSCRMKREGVEEALYVKQGTLYP